MELGQGPNIPKQQPLPTKTQKQSFQPARKEDGLPPQRRSSYASALRGHAKPSFLPGKSLDTPIPLNYIRPSEEGGRVRVVPPKGITVAGCKEWEKTLVGYFIGPRLHYPLVSAIAHKLWDAVGLEEVLSSENGFFFFKFGQMEALELILDRGPWHMANRPLVLKRWQPNLSLLKEDTQRIPAIKLLLQSNGCSSFLAAVV